MSRHSYAPEIAARLLYQLQLHWGVGDDPDAWIKAAARDAEVDDFWVRFVHESPYVVRLGIDWVYKNDDEIVWMRRYRGKADPYHASAETMGANGDFDDAEYWAS